MARYPQSILISCEIPWDENEQLLEDVFRREIQHVLRGFNNLYIFGTAGEGYAVDTARFQQIVRVFYEETRGPDIHPMVGVIALSTPTVIERISFACDLGFRVFQISLPSWGTVTDTEMVKFFRDVCGSFPNAQFLHYNLPRTGRVLTGREYRTIIEQVDNLVATKTTSGGLPGAVELMRNAPELQHFMGEANFPHGCMIGECSLLSSAGPMSPHKAKEYFAAGVARDIEKLFELQHAYALMKMDVIDPVRVTTYMDGAYDKLIKKLGGFEEMPLRLLSPYQGLTEEQFETSKRTYHRQYPDWVPHDVIR